MATTSLLSIFPKHEDLLALAPEDLGGVIIEVANGASRWSPLAQGRGSKQ
jgi:hypothetical protein